MVLDEPKETDDVFKVNGFTVVVDKNLHERTSDIKVDYVDYGMQSGFSISSKEPILGGGGGGCGTSCSC